MADGDDNRCHAEGFRGIEAGDERGSEDRQGLGEGGAANELEDIGDKGGRARF